MYFSKSINARNETVFAAEIWPPVAMIMPFIFEYVNFLIKIYDLLQKFDTSFKHGKGKFASRIEYAIY